MDGVIFDSERLVLESWQAVAKKYGINNVKAVMYECIGVNSVITKEIFLRHYGQDFPYTEYKKEASAIFNERFQSEGIPVKMGVRELLKYLQEENYLIGLASSTRYAIVKQEIEDAGLMPFFMNLTCGDMLKKSKPDPDIFLMACENLGVKPCEAIGVEDSYNGIRAVKRAGMLPIMVPDLIAPDEEMRELAGFIFPDLLAVQAWFQSRK